MTQASRNSLKRAFASCTGQLFEFMAGLRRTEVQGTAADAAFAVVVQLSLLSVLLFPIFGLYWLWLVAKARRRP